MALAGTVTQTRNNRQKREKKKEKEIRKERNSNVGQLANQGPTRFPKISLFISPFIYLS